jgi:hypothetical protein
MVHKKDSTWGSDLSTFVTGEFWWSTGQISLGNWRAWSEGWRSHPAALQQTAKSEIYPKSRRAWSRTYAQAAQRATPRPLGFGFFFSLVCGTGVCLSRRAQRADLYKTSTRHGAKMGFASRLILWDLCLMLLKFFYIWCLIHKNHFQSSFPKVK